MGDRDSYHFVSQEYTSSDVKYHALTLEKNFIIQSIKIHGYILLNQLSREDNDYQSIIERIFNHILPLKTTLLLFYINYMVYKKQSIPTTLYEISSKDFISNLAMEELVFIIKQRIAEWR